MYVKPSSRCRYSIVHLLPTSSSKSAPVPSAFYDFWGKVELSPLVSCTFCRPHLPKVLRDRLFFYDFCEIELSLQSRAPFADLVLVLRPPRNRALATILCAFCRPLPPIEPRNRGNRDSPLATTAATLPEKIRGFAPESVFKPEFTRSRSLTLPNY